MSDWPGGREQEQRGLVRYHTPSFAELVPDGYGRCLVCGALVTLDGFFAGGCPLPSAEG